jgi:hypothetical protein
VIILASRIPIVQMMAVVHRLPKEGEAEVSNKGGERRGHDRFATGLMWEEREKGHSGLGRCGCNGPDSEKKRSKRKGKSI